MISAEVARNMTEEYIKSVKVKQLEQIEKLIKEEAYQGSYEVYYEGLISDETEKELESLGYKVKIDYSSGEFGNSSKTIISWNIDN